MFLSNRKIIIVIIIIIIIICNKPTSVCEKNIDFQHYVIHLQVYNFKKISLQLISCRFPDKYERPDQFLLQWVNFLPKQTYQWEFLMIHWLTSWLTTSMYASSILSSAITLTFLLISLEKF